MLVALQPASLGFRSYAFVYSECSSNGPYRPRCAAPICMVWHAHYRALRSRRQSGGAATCRLLCRTIGGSLLIVVWNGGEVDATRTGCVVRRESSRPSRRRSEVRPSGAAYSSDSGNTLFEVLLCERAARRRLQEFLEARGDVLIGELHDHMEPPRPVPRRLRRLPFIVGVEARCDIVSQTNVVPLRRDNALQHVDEASLFHRTAMMQAP
jgi:hypothetical protein